MWTPLKNVALVTFAILALGPEPLAAQSQGITKALPGETTVRPGDVLEIGVWPNEELGGQFVVEESGFVYLPILGRIQATGISLARLREELRNGYGSLMKNPVVTVTPLVRVGVVGSVQRPGTYMANPTQNVFDILLEAGWVQPNADLAKVRIVRDGQAIPINAESALEGGTPPALLELQSGDRIVVPARNEISLRAIFTVVHSLLLAANLVQRIRD